MSNTCRIHKSTTMIHSGSSRSHPNDSWLTSINRYRPPGFKTRLISCKAFSTSLTEHITRVPTATSREASLIGRLSACIILASAASAPRCPVEHFPQQQRHHLEGNRFNVMAPICITAEQGCRGGGSHRCSEKLNVILLRKGGAQASSIYVYRVMHQGQVQAMVLQDDHPSQETGPLCVSGHAAGQRRLMQLCVRH